MVGTQLVKPLWKTVKKNSSQTKIEISYDLAIIFMGLYFQNTKILN